MQKNKLKKIVFNKTTLSKTPESPGVYLFYDKSEKVLYVGKSVNLRSRLYSYLQKNLLEKTRQLISEAEHFSYVKVGSELESLLLEARLIRKHQPKYNLVAKDDKHPLYIKITSEVYPRVLTARKIDERNGVLSFYGPFPSTRNVRIVLKMLRRIFKYSDHKLGKRACLRSQIGLCHPCPNIIVKEKDQNKKKLLIKSYKTNIRLINSILSGKITKTIQALEKEMKSLSKQNLFEEAAEIRSKLESVEYVTQPITPISHFLKDPNILSDIRSREAEGLTTELSKYITLSNLRRIECYDVAHLSGSNPAASMVTFINGDPEKNLYRHFRVRQRKGQSDIDSLAEVAKRREKYLAAWGKPDLIVVDGGKGQVSTFLKVFKKYKIPIIGLTKQRERVVVKARSNFVVLRLKDKNALYLLQRLRNEAHRFARKYHHQLVNRLLLNK